MCGQKKVFVVLENQHSETVGSTWTKLYLTDACWLATAR